MNRENHFESILNDSDLGFAYHRMLYDENRKPLDYIFLMVNQAFERLTGLIKEEILNKKITEVMPGIVDDDFDWISFYGAIADEGGKQSFEQYSGILSKWYRVEVFSHEKGYFTTLFTDITHEKLLADASKELLTFQSTKASFKMIAERMKMITGASIAVLDIFSEKDSQYQSVAITLEQKEMADIVAILGFNPLEYKWKGEKQRAELYKKNIMTSYEHLSDIPGITVSKRNLGQIEEQFGIDKIYVLMILKGDKVIGDFILVFSKGNQFRNEGDARIYVDLVELFIEKWNREKELEANRTLMRSIIGTLPGYLLVVDKECHIISVNQNMLDTLKDDYGIKSIIGKKCYQVFMKKENPCAWCKIREVLENGSHVIETTDPSDPRGSVFGTATQILLAPMKDADGANFGFIEYGVDISELQNARIKAEAANRAKDEFLATMSHELRTPLNGVLGFSQILKTTALDVEQQNYTDIIITSAKNLLAIITDILDIVRIEADKVTITPAKIKIRNLATEIFTLISIQAKEKDLKLVLTISDDCPEYIICDSARLKQILLNLISNAVKFTEKGTVALCVMVSEINEDENRMTLLFSVKDTGIGIKKEYQEYILQDFTQVDMSTTRRFGGTGLGLSIVQRLLKKMNSAISIDSVFGEGSTFSFPLQVPYFKEKDKFLQNFEFENEKEKRVKILIAEDDQTNMKLIKTALSLLFKKVDLFEADNGRKAYLNFLKNNPDLILMDIVMPEMDGYHATKMIREHDHEIPIIALTAKADLKTREDCLKVGMNDYLSKPLSLSELNRVIKKHLLA